MQHMTKMTLKTPCIGTTVYRACQNYSRSILLLPPALPDAGVPRASRSPSRSSLSRCWQAKGPKKWRSRRRRGVTVKSAYLEHWLNQTVAYVMNKMPKPKPSRVCFSEIQFYTENPDKPNK